MTEKTKPGVLWEDRLPDDVAEAIGEAREALQRKPRISAGLEANRLFRRKGHLDS